MTTYTAGGLPKPEATDLISNGWDAIADLADAVESRLAPIGSIVMWPTATPPAGWLICNGGTFTAATYPALNTLLGGNTLPDMRQRFPLGVAASGTGATVRSVGGQIDHVHSVDVPAVSTSASSVQAFVTAGSGTGVATTPHIHTFDVAPFNSGGQNPPWIALNFIIRAA